MRRLLTVTSARRKELPRDEEGTALVETTIAMPFLLILGLGVFEFGNVLYNHHLISTGVRDAARYLARFSDPATRIVDATWLAVTGTTTGAGDRRVNWWRFEDVTVDLSQTIDNSPDPITGERPYRGGETIQIVRVETTVTYGSAQGLGLLTFLGLSDSIIFTIAHEQRGIGE